jgi:hypothetical protein
MAASSISQLTLWYVHCLCDLILQFQLPYHLFFLRSSSSGLRLLHRCLVTFNFPSIFPPITCFRRQFLRKMWPVQLAFLLFIVLWYFSSHWLYVTLLHFSHERSNWLSPFSGATLQNFPGISDIFSEVSKFQHITQLCSSCSTLLVSSFHLSSICYWKEPSSCWRLLSPWQ